MDHIENLKLHNKDVMIVLGASRTGKGTLLSALQGQKMGFFKNKKEVLGTEVGKEAKQSKLLHFMAPVGANNLPVASKIMSMGHNSHTLFPKIPFYCSYPEQFEAAGLKDTYLIDFPGMFESRGPELDLAISLAL